FPAHPDLNWSGIYSLCRLHNVESVVYYSIKKLSKKPPENVSRQFEKAYKNHVVCDAVQCAEGELIASEFEKMGIAFLFLKGFIIKDYYPRSEMRSMGDIDILFRENDYKKIDDIMQNLGYKGSPLYENVYCYEKSNGVVVEMHNSLTRDGKDHFANPWERLTLKGSTGNHYEMTNEDFYIYMIMHAFRHYSNKGIGIRSVMDIYVFNKRFKDTLDYEHINKVFNDNGIYNFASKMKALSEFWFGNGKRESGLQNISDYILSGGTFGSFEASFFSDLGSSKQKNITIRKFRYIFKKLFPTYLRMCKSYPILRKHKYLLPYMWLVRGLKLLIFNSKHIFSVLIAVMKIKKSDMDRLKILHEEQEDKGDTQ
ncbi:MAG TPA: nucleotidyltransferase family protein, partial [Clostridia bacterium]|nr:nucleotidyltransferase family protein [Clostridia bacterium]